MRHASKRNVVVVVCTLAALFLVSSAAAVEPIIYPAKGQSESRMNKDKSECESWAVKQTGSSTQAAAPQEESSSGPKGERVRGGARGAAGGAAIGAIAGDAGKGAAIGATAGAMRGGMKQREERREEKSSKQQAAAQQEQQAKDTYTRAYSACLEGRGYTVK